MSRTALLVAALVALLAAAPAHAAVKPPKQRNARPAATLTWAPSAPHSGDMVVFNAATSDADGDAVSVAWDLDGDGRFESTSPAAVGWWVSPGPRTFTVRLTDARGAVTVLRRRVDVGDAPPVAAFTFTPDSPLTGGAVTFTSQSADPDGGTLALQQSWDLDGDGQYDDATGRTATATFPAGAPGGRPRRAPARARRRGRRARQRAARRRRHARPDRRQQRGERAAAVPLPRRAPARADHPARRAREPAERVGPARRPHQRAVRRGRLPARRHPAHCPAARLARGDRAGDGPPAAAGSAPAG